MLAVEEITKDEIIEKELEEMPSYNHSYICNRIIRQLLLNDSIEFMPELTLAIGKGLIPDICVYRKEDVQQPNFLSDIKRFEKLPIIAIEVISASQTIDDLLEKAKMMAQAGVKTVWTVEPFGRTIFVTTNNGTDILHNDLVESEGVTVDFTKIFGN